MRDTESLLRELAAAAGVDLDPQRRKTLGEILREVAAEERDACEHACLAMAEQAVAPDVASAVRGLATLIHNRGKPITRWRVEIPAAATRSGATPPTASAVLWARRSAQAPGLVGRFVFPCPTCSKPLRWHLTGFRDVSPGAQELSFDVDCDECGQAGPVIIAGKTAPPG